MHWPVRLIDGCKKWKPANYTKKFYGPSPMRLGIEKSRNLMTARLAIKLIEEEEIIKNYMDKGYTNNKRYLELLENGPKSLSQAWLLGALQNEWKKMKGYNKLEPKRNEGQLQSSLKEIFSKQKDQGI